MNLSAIFIQTLDVTLPVFSLVFIGIGMRSAGWIGEDFVSAASKIVFKGSMPALIFVSIVGADLGEAIRPAMILYFGLATLASFVLIWLWAIWRVPEIQRGVYVQGAFRCNGGIVGLALAQNMYGDFGLAVGSVLLGEALLMYNVLAVIVLSWYQPGQDTDWRSISRSVATNPLILATVISVFVAASGLAMPKWIMTTGGYFAQLTLPLALICIGGALSVRALYDARGVAFSAATVKMTILPGAAVIVGWLLGFAPRELGMMFVFFACPTSAASFIMVEAMGGDARLAANIVALTTLAASVTMSAGIFVLRVGGII
jgi:predicted permease